MKAVVRLLERYFRLTAHDTTLLREGRAGLTSFVTMAYILFLNPLILKAAIPLQGADSLGQFMTATALAAGFGSIVMGLLARYPFAMAPGMGLNAYFAYTVVLGQGVPWQTGLGIIFVSGLVIGLLTLTGIRRFVMLVLPRDIKYAVSAGIGLFLALIGAKNCGLIVSHPQSLVSLGELSDANVLLAILGLFLTVSLLHFNRTGAVLIGIVVCSLLAVVAGMPVYDGHAFTGWQHGFWQAPAWPTELFLSLDIRGAFDSKLFGVLATFVLVNVFDTAGTLLGLAQLAGYQDHDSDDATRSDDPGGPGLARLSHAFFADAVATSVGALIGTSGTTSYVESAAGIRDGGRSGLTAVSVGLLFLLSIFLWPLASAVPAAATSPALIIIGALMMGSAARIKWQDIDTAFPAFLTLFMMPFTFSIANGISSGVIAYVVIKVLTGRLREVHWLLRGLAALLVWRFVFFAA